VGMVELVCLVLLVVAGLFVGKRMFGFVSGKILLGFDRDCKMKFELG
jgi:hypothetical protein